jgi:hypothetical protein
MLLMLMDLGFEFTHVIARVAAEQRDLRGVNSNAVSGEGLGYEGQGEVSGDIEHGRCVTTHDVRVH